MQVALIDHTHTPELNIPITARFFTSIIGNTEFREQAQIPRLPNHLLFMTYHSSPKHVDFGIAIESITRDVILDAERSDRIARYFLHWSI